MVAIITGTGVESPSSWAMGKEYEIVTSYGRATLCEVEVSRSTVFFLPRHGGDHTTAPHLINHKANIAALKSLGVTHAVGICSVGSLRTDIPPGSILLLDDFINAAGGRVDSFYADPGSAVVHTDMSLPYCPNVGRIIEESCKRLGINIVVSGTYVGVTGPRYETPSEVRTFRIWGGDVVGMTNVPECVLAREAGLCYAALAMVTNLGTGLADKQLEHAEVAKVAASLLPTIEQILCEVIPEIGKLPNCSCQSNTVDIL